MWANQDTEKFPGNMLDQIQQRQSKAELVNKSLFAQWSQAYFYMVHYLKMFWFMSLKGKNKASEEKYDTDRIQP